MQGLVGAFPFPASEHDPHYESDSGQDRIDGKEFQVLRKEDADGLYHHRRMRSDSNHE